MSGLFGHTEAGVRDVREMVRRSKSRRFDKGIRWNRFGGSRPVIVRLDEDIDEDDFDEHPAEVLELSGSGWRGTKTFVMVRNAGQLPLEKDDQLTAIPIPNAGLCVCANERPGTFQPLNVGVMKSHCDALTESGSLTGLVSSAFSQMWPAANVYTNLQPEDISQRNYILNEKQRLHVVCVGMPPSFVESAWSPRRINATTTPQQFEAAQKDVNRSWVPEPDSPEDVAIIEYLANGGTVLCIIEQSAVYDVGNGIWFNGELFISGTRLLSPMVLKQRDKMQAWLRRVGSTVSILNREQIVPATPIQLPQWPIVVGCSHVPLLPPNGFSVVNPDCWLGRSKGLRRADDRRQRAKFAEMDAFRGGGWAAMNIPGSNTNIYSTAFLESNGPWVPSVWQSVGNALNNPANFAADFNPWSLGQMFGISAPRDVWFTAVHLGRRFWTNRFQFGPPEFSIGQNHPGWMLYGYDFIRQSDGIRHIDAASVIAIPTATAERLPNGGRLIVATVSSFPKVAEAIIRSIQSGDMLEHTKHFVGSSFAVVDRFQRDVSPINQNQPTLPTFTRGGFFSPPYRVFAFGDGITGTDAVGGFSQLVPQQTFVLQTAPEPEPAPPFSYRPNRDGDKTGWTGLNGVSAIWPTVSEEVFDDASGAFSAINSQSPLTLFFERAEPPASSTAVTVTFRAAKCDSGGAPTSTGTASLQLELLGGQSPPIVSTFVADLTNTIQEFTWTFNATERDWLFNFAANPRIRFRPNASGDCGVLLTYVAINAGRAGRFQSMLIQLSTIPVQLTTNLGECPYAHSWRGDHPIFNENLVQQPAGGNPETAGTISRFCVAWSENDLAAWHHSEFGLVTSGPAATPLPVSTDQFWRTGVTLQTSTNDRFSAIEKIVSLVISRRPGAGNQPTVTGPGGGVVDTFPVVFQNGRLLRPAQWETVHDRHVLKPPEFSDNTTLFDRYRARTSLKGWQDITRWPEVSDDPEKLIDIETDPDSPPVCVGVGTVTELRYGVSGAQKYTVSLSNGIDNLDLAIQVNTADVRALWRENYGGDA